MTEDTQEINDMIVTLTEGHRDWYLEFYKNELEPQSGGAAMLLDPLSDDLYYDLLMAYIAGAAHGVRLATEEITIADV